MKISVQKNYRVLIGVLVFVGGIFCICQDANAVNLKWFNKDMYNTSGVNGNDIDFLFSGATGAQIQAATVNTWNHPGFTGPTYGNGTVNDILVGYVQWDGPFPNDPSSTNKVHLGVKLDMDKLPNGGANVKFAHVAITNNGTPVAIAPACAKPEVVFVSDDVVGIDITSPFNDPGITIDNLNYAVIPEPIPLDILNGDNKTIEWISIAGSFDLNPDETIRIADVTVSPGNTHIVVSARVRFIDAPNEEGAGHVFFESELPPPPTGEPPTVSEWGLIIMALLLVTVGAIMIRKQRQVTA